MSKFNQKNVVVTGGNSGIGYATASEFVRLGANVTITGKNEAALRTAQEEIGGNIRSFLANQANLADLDKLVSAVKESYSQLDVLFINAGVVAMAPFAQITEEQFDQNMDINFKGAFFTLQKFLPLLKEGSNVIFLSSINAYSAMPNTAVYGASKAALNSLARTVATELSPLGIRVNVVAPGPVNTPIFGKANLPQEAIGQFAQAMQQRIPLKRFGNPEDIAKLVVFLASEDASFITGSEYVIDGGVNLNPILS